MARAVGAKSQVIIDEEITYKDDPGAPDAREVVFLTTSLKAEQSLIQDESIRGNRNRVAPVQGNLNVTGAIVVNLSETSHALLLKHTFGSVSTTGSEDPWTHTLSHGDLPVGLVIEKGFTDISEFHKFNGCRVSSLDVAATPEGFVTATFNIMGATEARSATSYDATKTTYLHEAFTSFQGTLSESGSPIATVTNFNFSISNELDEDGYAIDGSEERRDLPEGDVVVTGSIEMFFEDDVLLAKARAGTETSLEIVLDKGVSPARKVTFTIPELKLGRSGPEISGPKGIKVTFDFTAYYDDSTEASTVECEIVNGLATL